MLHFSSVRLAGYFSSKVQAFKTRIALYRWVSAWEILHQGTAERGGVALPRAARCVRCYHLHMWQHAGNEAAHFLNCRFAAVYITKKCQAQYPKASNRFPLPHKLFLDGISELPRGFCHGYRTQGESSSNHSEARKCKNHPLLPGSCSNFNNWCFKCIRLSSTG